MTNDWLAQFDTLVTADATFAGLDRPATWFTPEYRLRYTPEEAVADLASFQQLSDPAQRITRSFRTPEERDHQFRIKAFRKGGAIDLSDSVPVLEGFGLRVLEEIPSPLQQGDIGYIHDFLVALPDDLARNGDVMARAEQIAPAVAAVLAGEHDNDGFNQLVLAAGLGLRDAGLLRAWFRYMRQTGMAYGLATVASALRNAPTITGQLIALFHCRHDPAFAGDRDAASLAAEAVIETRLQTVRAIDDDTILRRYRSVILAIVRTNAFIDAGQEALAFKIDSQALSWLPKPVPWREIFVHSPRVDAIHLRGGPVARGGLRWSDRADDYRTEVLGLMKAQLVKNAVIVPTGAKGGFYPKRLPSPATDRDGWLAEGKACYQIFIRALLSVTDNIVDGAVVHPVGIVRRDDDDPYLVVAADKGTASFSDIANAIAIDHGFWLGDAFASGGSNGYDHKAMAITARGAWISVQRHFRELGVDVQRDPVRVIGVGDMSGDVFGNGMLLSRAIRLVAAFDHRHIFIDPAPDPEISWAERDRLFRLPRSSWADYDAGLISTGGGVFPRDMKAVPLSDAMRAMLGVTADALPPAELIAAVLTMQADLVWFGGIGTYIKASTENNADVRDPANDSLRIDATQFRAKVIGEGANLGVTQAARVELGLRGVRLNTDFIDNSAGVDCSDHEVNIKIALQSAIRAGRLTPSARDALLVDMTNDVAGLVLEDNRLQTIALSVAAADAANDLAAHVRVIELLEEHQRLIRSVEGLGSSDALLRRRQDNHGLTRPELAVLLSHGKLAIQAGIEMGNLADDVSLEPMLIQYFPRAMRDTLETDLTHHQLRREIIATGVANLVVNRLGPVVPFELAEEENAALAHVAAAYIGTDRIFGLTSIWQSIEQADVTEAARFDLMRATITAARRHMADLLRTGAATMLPGEMTLRLQPGVARLVRSIDGYLRQENGREAIQLQTRLQQTGAAPALIDAVVNLCKLDGVIGIAWLASQNNGDVTQLTAAYVRLGEALGLDWARMGTLNCQPRDSWERLMIAGIARDFEQFRLDFLRGHDSTDPLASVDRWLQDEIRAVTRFRTLIDRARKLADPGVAVFGHIAAQARNLLDQG